MAGEVVGITTMKLEGGENLNFAIPINDVKPLLLSDSSKLQDFPHEYNVEKEIPGEYNIVKEILDRKDTLNWKLAGNGIPADVCTIFQVCNGTTTVIALPRTTEGGQPVGHGVFLTQNTKHADVLVLERQTPLDTYFFLLTSQGTLSKAAYAQVNSRAWGPDGHGSCPNRHSKRTKSCGTTGRSGDNSPRIFPFVGRQARPNGCLERKRKHSGPTRKRTGGKRNCSDCRN